MLEDAEKYKDEEGILGEFIKRSSRYKKNQFRLLISGFSLIVLLLSGLSLFAFAFYQKSKADRYRKKAEIEKAILESEAVFYRGEHIESFLIALRVTRNFKNSPSIEKYSQVEDQIKKVLEQSITQTYERNRLEGHQDVVNNAQFSPDGNYIVTASWDNTAKLWKREEELHRELHRTLSGHQKVVNNAQFSSDGKYIVTASRDKTAKVWRSSGELLATLSGYKDVVYNAQFSPDGQYIVTASGARRFEKLESKIINEPWHNTVKLWTREGELLATLSSHQDSVINSIKFFLGEGIPPDTYFYSKMG